MNAKAQAVITTIPMQEASLDIWSSKYQLKTKTGEPVDKDLYDLPPEVEKDIPTVCFSLEQALEELDNDRGFLTAGGVFSDHLIDGYLEPRLTSRRPRPSTAPCPAASTTP